MKWPRTYSAPPEGLAAKVERAVAREIRDSVLQDQVGRRHTGWVQFGGHTWGYDVTVTELKIEVPEMTIEWDQEG